MKDRARPGGRRISPRGGFDWKKPYFSAYRSTWPQDGDKTQKNWPKRAPVGPQEGLKRAQEGPKRAQEGPGGPQEGTKRPQEAPSFSKDDPLGRQMALPVPCPERFPPGAVSIGKNYSFVHMEGSQVGSMLRSCSRSLLGPNMDPILALTWAQDGPYVPL